MMKLLDEEAISSSKNLGVGKAKKELKKGNQAKAKEMIAKYTLMNINAWVKVTEK
jgi:hypothetical protein